MAPTSKAKRALRRHKKQTKEPTLSDQLIDCLQKSNFHDPEQEYYPVGHVRRLINLESIEKEFRRCDKAALNWDEEEDKDAVIRRIHQQAYKTFATAVVCEFGPADLLDFMLDYQEQDLTDVNLPMISEETIEKYGNAAKAHHFCVERWKFLAPIFSPDEYDYNVPNEYIFPFAKDATMSRSGAFGTVSRVEVHADHQRHINLQYVAIKEIQIPQDKEMLATDKAWEDEAKALRNIKNLDHPHITKCIAAIRRGERRYFMFEWAGGGNLKEYWKQTPRQNPDAKIIQETIEQLRGLADALYALHSCNDGNNNRLTVPGMQGGGGSSADNEKSIRHGDLKPENILRFIRAPQLGVSHIDKKLGTLKIADMGLAKQHIVATQLRTNTSQRYGTIRYEAPEAITETKGRSRLYDVWSMGCIILEFIIWILHGNDVLEEFYTQVEAGRKQTCQYFELDDDRKRAEIHHIVSDWMDRIGKSDPECSQDTAIRDLLTLVRNRLLVVELDPNPSASLMSRVKTKETISRFRATAAEFRDTLDGILEKAKRHPAYLCTGKNRENIRLPSRYELSSPFSAAQQSSPLDQRFHDTNSRTLSGAAGRLPRLEYALPPLKDWEFPVDNAFAEQLQAKVGTQALYPSDSRTARLCQRCTDLDFWAGGFTLPENFDSLAKSANVCDLCHMLYSACRHHGYGQGDDIQLDRIQSNLKLSGAKLPALSIFRSSNLVTPTPIQLGFPILPEPGSNVFFELIRLWLRDCDTKHADCRPMPRLNIHTKVLHDFPTRLIDVGTVTKPLLKLIETREEVPKSHEYIALSHPWGDIKKYPPFSTWRRDRSGMGHDIDTFKRAIPYGELPATFKDAVDCTRALGVRYLWIDSVCIIQGRDGDFNQEAKNMEEVFSGAYCVLAASRASNQHDGFLGPRPQRKFITIQGTNGKPFYVCEPIDDFNKDVIEGSLNQRGWVLQERALARRTIYFTKNQTYFECGNGIRCETLASMHNTMADFIGDPRFPEKAMRSNSRALKIEYYQDLYRLYSRLQFSRYEDRPFAIAGLEKRLRQAFDTKGGYGIFDDGDKSVRGLFHRSILWQRGEEKEFENGLVSIDFPAHRNVRVPSWSWMAYQGGIDYVTPPGGTADWEMNDISEPWTRGFGSDTDSAPQDGIVAIPAIIRDFKVGHRLPDEVKLVYDTGRTRGSDGQRAQCVIVAKDKHGRSEGTKRHYVLLVATKQAATGRGRRVYERIGAGYILGKYIALSDTGIKAEIQ